MASESQNDGENLTTLEPRAIISRGGIVETNDDENVSRLEPRGYISRGGMVETNDDENVSRLEPRGYISRGGIVERPHPNFYENFTSRGGDIIDRDTLFKGSTVFCFGEEETLKLSEGETSPNDDEQVQQERSGSGAYNKEQKEIEKAVMIIGSNMKTVLADIKPVLKSCTIYKVPQKLKDVYGSTSFEPKLVGIGPFYHFEQEFQAMYTHKWRFFSRFLNSMNDSTSSTTSTAGAGGGAAESSSTTTDVATHSKKIECLFVALKKLEASTRASYSENFHHLDSAFFIQMMMIDGCFIIELLRLCEKLGKENVVDPLFSSRWTIPNLRHDLLMLENQLPFPVLETLFEMSSTSITSSGNVDQHQQSLKYLILKFFDPLLPREKKVLDHVLTVVKDNKPHHLLDFFRSSFRMEQDTNSTHINVSPSTSNDDQDRLVLIHCVTELKEAGVEFKKRENHNLLDIEFKNGKLYIPPLLIDENTSSAFLNFLVYEQSNQFLEPYFTNYLLFLDGLVDSSTDIEHLHYKGIIDHVLSSDEQVADLFNKLCKDAVHDLADNYLSNVLKDVNRYTGRRWNRWRAAWKHTYFRNPWAFSSFLAAVFLLILTTIQTFFSVYAYVAPPS